MTVAGQSAISYGYDDANRLTSITQGSATVTITYDNSDRPVTVTYPNGIVRTNGYNAASQVTSITYTVGATTLGDVTYTYDVAGNKSTVGGSWARTGLPVTLGGATYDAANRVVTWDATSFGYDLNGDLTSDGATTYTWNARRELSAIAGTVNGSFGYDGLRRRRTKTIGGTTANFLFDDVNLIQEQSGGGSPTANLLTGLGIDETFTRSDGAGTRALLTDDLGSPIELADNSATLQTHYTFEPFGAVSVSGATSTNSLQFSGRERDTDQLSYYRMRYYHPKTQRFASEDPLDFMGGDTQLYGYVGNRPTQFIDPWGLKPTGGRPRLPGTRIGPGGPRIGPGGPVIGPDTNPDDPPPNQRCSGGPGGAPGALGATVIASPWGVGVGPAVSVAYIPTTGEWFVAPGVGASLGHSVSFGPLLGPNPSGVLPEWSLAGGYNITPWRGVQGVVNRSGALSGNSFGTPGWSASVTYGFCF
jgi:RHS repeat-associated protein